MAPRIVFDPSDSQVGRFLSELAFTPQEIATGSLDPATCEQKGLDFVALSHLANAGSIEFECEAVETPCEEARLDSDDLERFYSLGTEKRQLFYDLLKTDRCPGKGGAASLIAGQWVWGLLYRRHSRFGNHCAFPDYRGFRPEELRGIHFDDSQVPPAIVRAGQAVHFLGSFNQGYAGSGVLVSAEGDLYSAWHVLDRGGGSAPRVPRLPVADASLVGAAFVWSESRPERDLVKMNLPRLAGQPFLKPARRLPRRGEVVWVIGFPAQKGAWPEGRRYTLGVVQSYDRRSGEITIDGEAWFGYSGGAIVSRDGRQLYGIVSQVALSDAIEREDLTIRDPHILAQRQIYVRSTVGITTGSPRPGRPVRPTGSNVPRRVPTQTRPGHRAR